MIKKIKKHLQRKEVKRQLQEQKDRNRRFQNHLRLIKEYGNEK